LIEALAPQRILADGRIRLTAESAAPVQALAISGGRVVASGTTQEILTLAAPSTEVDRLGGRTVIPGLIDAHLHLEQYALGLEKLDCETRTREECLDLVRRRSTRTAPGAWIVGHGWNQNHWDRYGTAEELESAAPGHPVYLTAKSLHAAWASTEALRLAAITPATPDPARGSIGRNEAGEPSGILFEEAMGLVAAHVPAPSAEHTESAIAAAQERLWRFGLTGIHDFDGPRCLRALQGLRATDRLGLRVVKHIRSDEGPAALAAGIQTGLGDEWIRIGNLKLFMDGALGPRTAAMLEPYDSEPENLGLLAKTAEELEELGTAASHGGIALAIHAIGDRANREALKALEAIRATDLRGRRLRHRVEHMQLLHPDDLPRAAAAGIVASMQPIHATSDMVMADQYWGGRCRSAYAWRSLIRHGTLLAFGSDAPVETPNPFAGIHAAVTRRLPDGRPGPEGWIPSERITLPEALRAYTRGSAFAGGLEKDAGSLEVGFLADLLVIETDLFSARPEEIAEVRPVATMVGGTWRFREF
jgi:predicted amidohydrolase YtcJ